MEQHSGDFSVTVRDVRQLSQPESDLLTLLWVLEGSVNLTEAEGAPQQLAVDELAIVNRNRRWSLRSAGGALTRARLVQRAGACITTTSQGSKERKRPSASVTRKNGWLKTNLPIRVVPVSSICTAATSVG